MVPVEVEAEAWAAERERAFPAWAACFGGSEVWDFTLTSFQAIADVVFHQFPTVVHLDDPANAEFTEGATWYLGEILRRAQPREWRWLHYDDREPWRADQYRLARKTTTAWPIAPRRKLNGLIASGYPLDLYCDDNYLTHTHPWPWGYFDTDTGTWTWTGQGWQCQRELWVYAVAVRITTLASDYLPNDVALDYSAKSLRRIEEFAIDNPTEDPAFTWGVAAYVGETLLRAVGGRWLWDDVEHSVTRGFPVVQPDLGLWRRGISPVHLLSFALKWRDGVTLTRAYTALWRRARERKTREPTWKAKRLRTPGLDPMPQIAPGYCDTWRAEQEGEFPNWAAQYGAGRSWDFSRNSLLALGEIMVELRDAGGALNGARECAAWYFGETLHRARPSHWSFNANEYDNRGQVVGRRPNHPWWISITSHSRVGFDGWYPLQWLDHIFRWDPALSGHPPAGRRTWGWDPDDSTWLRYAYDRWVTAEVRERVEESHKRRLGVKRRVWRNLSDDEYLQRWLGEREAQFPTWVHDYGGDGVWDFSPKSLDILEELVIQWSSIPEQLLEGKQNAPFLDGALWYLGEVLRRGRPATWKYTRGDTSDPTVGQVEPLDGLTDVLTSVDRGALCRWYDGLTALE